MHAKSRDTLTLHNIITTLVETKGQYCGNVRACLSSCPLFSRCLAMSQKERYQIAILSLPEDQQLELLL